MNYILEKELKDVALKLCESSVNYNTNIKEKDKSFKVLFEVLFEVKGQFIQLLKTFVKEEWIREIKEENIELVDKEFTTVNLEERRADVVYRIKLKKQEIYFFLLEIQSKIDKMMPFRLYEYMLELYRKYKEKDELPLVIPCVLYTGNEKWNVGELKDLFKVRKEVEKYIPNFEYIVLDVNNYKDEELIEISNLISSVFYLSKSKTEKAVVKRIEKLLKLMKLLTEEEQKSLARWTRTMFIKSNEVQEYLSENNIYEEEEENMALVDLIPGAIEIWKQQAREEGLKEGRREGKKLGLAEGRVEGRAEGRAEGRVEGRAEGRAEGKKLGIKRGREEGRVEGRAEGRKEGELNAKMITLKRILIKKLNQNPPKEIDSKLEKMTIEELEGIEDRIFEIESWEEV